MIQTLLQRIGKSLHWLEKTLTLALFVLLVSLSAYQLAMRNMGFTSPGWIDPVLHRVVLWIGLLGAVLAAQSNEHLRLELLPGRVPQRFERYVRTMISGIGALVCILLSYASYEFMQEERALDASSLGGMPGWTFTIIIPTAFLLMALHFVIHLATNNNDPTAAPTGPIPDSQMLSSRV